MSEREDLEPLPLPTGIRSRIVEGVNGLDMHVLEAGHESGGRPLLVLLHGFPELAFSWRKVMLPLAEAGYHVVAPDQRGYGRTVDQERGGRPVGYDDDLSPFRMVNLTRDVMGLVAALGRGSVEAVIGHDFGSPVAAWCALLRPDVFRCVALMSAPFGGPPRFPIAPDGSAGMPPDRVAQARVHDDLAALAQPRKHYQWYYSTREADADMRHAPQGLHAFLRAYYHHKSADWVENKPYPLAAWSAEELAKLPTYYVMDLHEDMAETVSKEMPSADQIAQCGWLTEAELAVYAQEFARTGFQASLNWYRCRTSGLFDREHEVFSGRRIEVPACFIAGRSDWGVHQKAGEFEKMQTSSVCRDFRGAHLIEGAGHWVQQEQPDAVVAQLLKFLGK